MKRQGVVTAIAGLAVGFAVTGWQSRAAAPAPALSERSKWEYKALYQDSAAAMPEIGLPKVEQADGQPITNLLAARLNKLGEEGWQLAAVHKPDGQPHVFVFKRLK